MHPALIVLAIWLLIGPVALTAWTLAAALRMLGVSLYGQLVVQAVRYQQRAARAPKALATSPPARQLSTAA
jgi:hypothetical protein